MNNILLSLAALLILVLSALFAAPLIVDWNDYRAVFEAQATKLLGREVTVGGKVHLLLLPAPELSFDDVKVADERGSLATPFLEAKSFTASLAIGPLLNGTLEARKITLAEPVLRLRLKEDGTGNWGDVGRAGVGLPFAPSTVTLDDVAITGGRIEFVKGSEQVFVVDQVGGELSARSLFGPYRFTGSYEFEGRPQELRFSTSAADADGRFRLKASLRDPELPANYLLDGEVTGLSTKPAFAGAIIASFSRARAIPNGNGSPFDAPTPAPEKTSLPTAGIGPAGLELKGELHANPDRLEMPALELSIHDARRPQTLKGDLAVDLGPERRIEAALQARWIDIDALLSNTIEEESRVPLAELAALSDLLLAHAAKLPRASLSLSLDQASLGGDLLSGVRLALALDKTGIAISRLEAELPGETKIEVSGRIEEGPVFTGPAKLQGAKLQTFVRWAGGDRDVTGQAASGNFALSGDVTLAAEKLILANATGELSDTKFSGAFTYAGGARRVLALSLDSDRLDLREVLGAGVTWRSLLPAPTTEQAPQIAPTPLAALKDSDVEADLRIGELLLPDIPAGRLDAKFAFAGDVLDVTRLDFTAGDVLAVRGQGKIERLIEMPSGTVDLAVKAQTPQSVRALAGFLGFSAGIARDDPHFDRLAPLDLTVALAASRASETKATAALSGTAGGATLTLKAELDGDVSNPAESSLQLQGSLASGDPQSLLALLFPRAPRSKLQAAGTGKAELQVELQGVPSKRVNGNIGLTTGTARLSFKGEGSLSSDTVNLSGRLDAASQDAALIVALAGLEPAPSTQNVAVAFATDLIKSGAQYKLDKLSGRIGDQEVSGDASIDLAGEKPRISADLSAGRVSLPAVLGLLVAWDRSPATEDVLGAIGVDHAEIWPSRGFGLWPLSRIDGALKLSAKDLALSETLQLTDAKLDASVEAGALKIRDLKGTLLGGGFTASADVTAAGSGAALKAEAALTSGRLDALTRAVAGTPLAEGSFNFKAKISGEGLSPPGLVAGLEGEGSLEMEPGTLQRLTVKPLQSAAAEAVKFKRVKADKEKIEKLAADVRDKLTKGTFNYESADFSFSIRSGTLRLKPGTLTGAGAKIGVNGFIELASLKVDSEWVLEPQGAAASGFPPVSLVFAGRLADAAAIAPVIDSQPIESYFTVRRMQEDVERLEKLDVTGRTPPGEVEAEEAAEVPSVPPPEKRPAREAGLEPHKVPVPGAVQTVVAPPAPQPSKQPSVQPTPGDTQAVPSWTATTTPATAPGATATPEAQPAPSDPSLPGPAPQEQAIPATPGSESPLAAAASEEAAPPAEPVVQPRPRRPKPAPDDWKKGISVFGGH